MSYVVDEDASRARIFEDATLVTDPLHRALVALALYHDNTPWGTGPALYTVTGDSLDAPQMSHCAIDPRATGMAETGTVLCEAMTYAIHTAGHLSLGYSGAWPMPYWGHAVVEEGWGLWGEAARRELEARGSNRRRVPIRHRPDRTAFRTTAVYTVDGRLVTVVHRRGEGPMLLEPHREHIQEALGRNTLVAALSVLTDSAVKLLAANGLMPPAVPPAR